MRQSIIHTIGEFAIRDDQVLYVEWNARAMMVATTVRSRVARGTGLLNLLPEVVQRRSLSLRVGTQIEPIAPFVRTDIVDISSDDRLPHCTQRLPGVLLDFPSSMIVFESGTRLIVARWLEVLAVGWKGNAFWFAIGNVVILVHPLEWTDRANRIPFLEKLLLSRSPGCYSAVFSEQLQRKYGLQTRYYAERITVLPLDDLAQDRSSINAAIALRKDEWIHALSNFRSRGMEL